MTAAAWSSARTCRRLPTPMPRLASNIPADPCGGILPSDGQAKLGTIAASAQHSGTRRSAALAAAGVSTSAATGVGRRCHDHDTARGRRPRDLEWSALYGQKAERSHLEHRQRLRPDHRFHRGQRAATPTRPTGDGTLDFNAPTTGPWKGIAIYQDPNLTTGVDISEAGNSPTWKITGMVYLPQSSVTIERRNRQVERTANRASALSSKICSSTARVRSWRTVAAPRQVSTCPPAPPRRAVEHWSCRWCSRCPLQQVRHHEFQRDHEQKLPSRRISARLRSFWDDHRGVAGIEFALVAGVLCILLMNGIEVARYAYTVMQVQNAAQVGAQSAWKACDPNKELPATTKCPSLNTAIAAAIKSTTLGDSVNSANSPTEAYYCLNNCQCADTGWRDRARQASPPIAVRLRVHRPGSREITSRLMSPTPTSPCFSTSP